MTPEPGSGPYRYEKDGIMERVKGPGLGENEYAFCIPENEQPSVPGLSRSMNIAWHYRDAEVSSLKAELEALRTAANQFMDRWMDREDKYSPESKKTDAELIDALEKALTKN